MALARYDAVADFYVSGFDATDDPASAALLDVLGPVAGLRVLDAACGHGRITRELARRGAAVVGVDISGKLLGTTCGWISSPSPVRSPAGTGPTTPTESRYSS